MVETIGIAKKRRRTNAALLMARLVDRHGRLISRAAIQSIDFVAVAIADEGGAVRPAACIALDPSAVLLDGLRNDKSWSVDAVGYNFCHHFDLSTINFPLGSASCEIRYVFRDTSDEIWGVRFQVGVNGS